MEDDAEAAEDLDFEPTGIWELLLGIVANENDAWIKYIIGVVGGVITFGLSYLFYHLVQVLPKFSWRSIVKLLNMLTGVWQFIMSRFTIGTLSWHIVPASQKTLME